MAQPVGIGGYLAELNVSDGNANYKFVDPDDAANTAEVSINKKDFPEDVAADSRQVLDAAFAQAAKVLNDKKDARLRKEAAAEFSNRQAEEARVREAQADFHNTAVENVTQPAKVDDEGQNVYNTDTSPAPTSDPASDKKK